MISNRIKTIASLISPYKKIADIGCDHGYLIIEAFLKYDINYAIAVDNKKGPLDSAKLNLKEYNLDEKVRFSLSSGISDIDNDTEVVVISGMGGTLIKQILSEKDKLKNIKRLVLQPNRNSYELRRFLMDNGYIITSEKLVYEEDKYYEVIQAEIGVARYTDDELLFGPILMKEKSDIFIKKLKEELKRLSEIESKVEKVVLRIKKLEEILCL